MIQGYGEIISNIAGYLMFLRTIFIYLERVTVLTMVGPPQRFKQVSKKIHVQFVSSRQLGSVSKYENDKHLWAYGISLSVIQPFFLVVGT